MFALRHLAEAIRRRLDSGTPVPLLVLRVPEFERIAWRKGRRDAQAFERHTVAAFARAAPQILRRDDVPAHENGSDCFAVALFSPARRGDVPGSNDARSALERIAAAMSACTGTRLEGGWWPLECSAEIEAFAATLEAALKRGARERRDSEMLATVGHELRTPLTSIRGYIETLLDGELDASTTRRFLETARREALRLGRFVEGMLEFSMLDLSARGRNAHCDVVARACGAVDAVTPLARDRRVTIRVQLPQAAPARIDGDACTHALVNLLENGVKYCGDGGTVEIACAREEQFVVVTVDDDGPGIAQCERDRIFELGTRGVAACGPGTGIGLAVVRAIANRAGGDVRVLQSPLGGARFLIRFPAI
jgi:signal transduction histidine kinase